MSRNRVSMFIGRGRLCPQVWIDIPIPCTLRPHFVMKGVLKPKEAIMASGECEMSCPICDGPMMDCGNPFQSDGPEVVYCPPCTIRKLAAFDWLHEAYRGLLESCRNHERDIKSTIAFYESALAKADKDSNNGN